MKKDLFYIGRFGVHGYGLMIGIGFILALFLGEYRAKKKGMKEEAISFMESSGVPSSADWWEPDCFIIL